MLCATAMRKLALLTTTAGRGWRCVRGCSRRASPPLRRPGCVYACGKTGLLQFTVVSLSGPGQGRNAHRLQRVDEVAAQSVPGQRGSWLRSGPGAGHLAGRSRKDSTRASSRARRGATPRWLTQQQFERQLPCLRLGAPGPSTAPARRAVPGPANCAAVNDSSRRRLRGQFVQLRGLVQQGLAPATCTSQAGLAGHRLGGGWCRATAISARRPSRPRDRVPGRRAGQRASIAQGQHVQGGRSHSLGAVHHLHGGLVQRITRGEQHGIKPSPSKAFRRNCAIRSASAAACWRCWWPAISLSRSR